MGALAVIAVLIVIDRAGKSRIRGRFVGSAQSVGLVDQVEADVEVPVGFLESAGVSTVGIEGLVRLFREGERCAATHREGDHDVTCKRSEG